MRTIIIDKILSEGLIDESLAYKFFKLNENKAIDKHYFSESLLPVTAQAICKYVTQLIFAYIFALCRFTQETVDKKFGNTELSELMISFWTGNSKLNYHHTFSIIKAFSKIDDIGFTRSVPEILDKWQEVFMWLEQETRGPKEIMIDLFDVEELFLQLIISMPLLSKTKIDDNFICFLLDDKQLKVNRSPFFHFYSNYYEFNDLELITCTPSKVSIDMEVNTIHVFYSDPYTINDVGIPATYVFNGSAISKEEFSFFKAIGINFLPISTGYEGNFLFLSNIIFTVKNVFLESVKNQLAGMQEGNKWRVYHTFLNYLHGSGDDKNNFMHNDKRVTTPSEFENALWSLTLSIGVYTFIKRVLIKYDELTLLEMMKKLGITDKTYDDYLSETDKFKEERRTSIIWSLQEGSEYYKSRNKIINEQASIIFLLKAAGLNTTNLITDYSKLISIDDFIRHVEENSIANALSIMEGIWKFLLCFYTGLISYCDCVEKRNSEENVIISRKLDNLADQTMITVSSEKFEEIKMLDYKNGLGRLNSLLINAFEKLDKKGYSKKYFGRAKMCHTEYLKEFYKYTEDRNSMFHHKIGEPIPDNKDYENIKSKTLEWLNFLKTGIRQENRKSTVDTSMCIYPQVISFKESIIQRNSINVVGYETIECPSTDKKQTGKYILSNQQLLQFKEYYCIPHMQRSTDEWLIEPFLISCEELDQSIPVFRVSTE